MDDKFFVEAYRIYRQALAAQPDFAKYADYEWHNLPDKMNASWLPYSLMLPEYSRSLANTINQLGDYSRRLRAWDTILDNYNDDEKLEALFEFVDPIATISLNLPYAIQSRFYFAIAHLCHQANKAKLKREWKDDLPEDGNIKANTAKERGVYWLLFPALDASVANIFSRGHQSNTDEFRHKFTHRVPTQVVLGHSAFVRRSKNNGVSKLKYEFGDRPPINIKILADELACEFRRCIIAFDDFKALVAEQVELIKINNPVS